MREGLMHFRIGCDEKDIKALLFYMEELMRWNKKINLTGIKDVERAVRELLYDAFFLNGYVKNDHSVLDLGSGAGVLAIPLSIINEDIDVFSVDKSLRKIQFQRHIKRTLNLKGFSLLHGRVEEIASLRVDSLVVKAFGSVSTILEKGGAHIKPGGRALIIKGKREEPADFGGFILEDTICYELPMVSKSYKLLIYKRVS